MLPAVRYDPSASTELVLLSVQGLAEGFFSGMDEFLIALFSDKQLAPVAEARLNRLFRVVKT